LRYHHEKIDPKANQETTPEQDEQIRVPSIWVFEAYPPSFINNFKASIEKLGWNSDEQVINPNITDTIDGMRGSFFGGGWINIGYIEDVSKKSRGFRHERQAHLPEGIKFIRASALQFIPSTTILIFQFFFNEDVITSLVKPLRDTYKTYIEPFDGGLRYYDVHHQKKAAVDVMRGYLRSICTNWINENIPGLFSSGISDCYLPTCEIILLAKHTPYERNVPFLDMLDLNEYEAWKSEKLQGLYFQFPRFIGDELGRVILSGNINEILPDKDLNEYGNISREDRIIHYLDDLDYTLGTWILYVIARHYEKHISAIRDSYGNMAVEDVSSTIKDIQTLDRELLQLQRDAIPFAENLNKYCQNEKAYTHGLYKFKTVAEKLMQTDLFEYIREYLNKSAISIISSIEQMHSMGEHTSRIVATITNKELNATNIKLQRSMVRMTFVLVVLTIALVVIAVKDLVNPDCLHGIIRRIVDFNRVFSGL
jgi:hypothetical protein